MNIQEYVAERVIAHMKYRDEEIEILQKELEILREKAAYKADIIKCDWCNEYSDYDWECEFCERKSCTGCKKVKKYPSWNLSGCTACDDCEAKYCTQCRSTKEECSKLPICSK